MRSSSSVSSRPNSAGSSDLPSSGMKDAPGEAFAGGVCAPSTLRGLKSRSATTVQSPPARLLAAGAIALAAARAHAGRAAFAAVARGRARARRARRRRRSRRDREPGQRQRAQKQSLQHGKPLRFDGSSCNTITKCAQAGSIEPSAEREVQGWGGVSQGARPVGLPRVAGRRCGRIERPQRRDRRRAGRRQLPLDGM